MKKRTGFFLCVYTIIIMFFCVGSSPFIDCMGTDSSVFFMMGRGMANGMTAYRELFDHKGWYIYFFNMVGAFISSSDSVGLFCVECIFAILDVFICYFIASNYVSHEKALVFSSLMLAVFLNYVTFQLGNFTETYAITFILLSEYLIVLYSQKRKPDHPPAYMFVHGINVGVIFFMRANMILIYGAIAIIVLLRLAVCRKYLNILHNIMAGIAGVLLAFLPPVIYSLYTNSFRDMIGQMILFNLNYSGGGSITEKIMSSLINPVALAAVLVSVLSYFVVRSRCDYWISTMFLLAIILSLGAITVSGRNYWHYYEYLLPLFVPFVLWVVSRLPVFDMGIAQKMLLVLALAAVTIIVNLETPMKIYGRRLYSLTESDNIFEERFKNKYDRTYAAEMMADEYRTGFNGEGKVLVLGNNAIFYNKFDTYPDIKYFYIPAISYDQYPDAIDAQVDSVLSGENDIIISESVNDSEYYGRIIKELHLNYRVLTEINGFQMWVKK